jgi:hypothetical protein
MESPDVREPIFLERDGREVPALYLVRDGELHVYVAGYVRTTELGGSKPEVLAEILGRALLDELVADGLVDPDEHRRDP